MSECFWHISDIRGESKEDGIFLNAPFYRLALRDVFLLVSVISAIEGISGNGIDEL